LQLSMAKLQILLCVLLHAAVSHAGDQAQSVQDIPGSKRKIIIVEKKAASMPQAPHKPPDVEPIVQMVGEQTKRLEELLKGAGNKNGTGSDWSFLKPQIEAIQKALETRHTHAKIPVPPLPPPQKMDLGDLAKAMKAFADDLAKEAKDAAGPSLADMLKDWLKNNGANLMSPDPLPPPPSPLRKDMLDDLKGWMDDLKKAVADHMSKPLPKVPNSWGMMADMAGAMKAWLEDLHKAIVEKVDPPQPPPQVAGWFPPAYFPPMGPPPGVGIGPAGGGYVGYQQYPAYYSGEGPMPPSFRAYPNRNNQRAMGATNMAAADAPGMQGYNMPPGMQPGFNSGPMPYGQPPMQFGPPGEDSQSPPGQGVMEADSSNSMPSMGGLPSMPGMAPPEMPQMGGPPPAAPELEKLYSMAMQ